MSDPIDSPFLQPLEPTAQQQGVDVPGFYSATTDFINFGVYNGNFRVGPPQAASNLDVATSLTGSNFLPGWRFVQSSNTTITARLIDDPRRISPSGSNVRFTLTAPTINDEAFIEQIIDVGGSTRQDVGAVIRSSIIDVSGFAETRVRTQYLNAAGTVDGMPPERTVSYAATSVITHPAEVDNPPSSARYLRVRICVFAKVSSAQTWTVDVYEVRRDRPVADLRLVERDAGLGAGSVSDVYQSGSNLFWAPSSTLWGTTTAKRLLNYQLVPIPFSLVNIPQDATTELQMWGDTALALGAPRIGSPWPGSIVGMSYRLSAAPTAGGASALRLQATVGGASVWTAFTLSGTGEPTNNEATQAVGTDDFTSGQQLGVQVVTSGTYAPTTADIAVVLWVALRYGGE